MTVTKHVMARKKPHIYLSDIDTYYEAIDKPISMEEIETAIKETKNHKAPGDDRINNEMLKVGLPYIGGILCQLFNTCYDNGRFPWKKGTIVPIYKNKGKKTDPKNYRPITLVSAL